MIRLLLAAAIVVPACRQSPPEEECGVTGDYTVVNEYPHDSSAYTQGLLFVVPGQLLESTGLFGQSSLRSVPLRTGVPDRLLKLPADRFAEGIALLDDKLYQLTWQSQVAYVYSATDFRLVDSLPYQGEGWGLTTCDSVLVMSNGSDTLVARDPGTFQVLRAVPVQYSSGHPVHKLNELECFQGQVFANLYQSDWIVRIEWSSGVVQEVIDLSGLLPTFGAGVTQENVLNGIAIDPATGHLFVTGKRWPKVFELRLKPRS
jgi:glutamine cyclotransferase